MFYYQICNKYQVIFFFLRSMLDIYIFVIFSFNLPSAIELDQICFSAYRISKIPKKFSIFFGLIFEKSQTNSSYRLYSVNKMLRPLSVNHYVCLFDFILHWNMLCYCCSIIFLPENAYQEKSLKSTLSDLSEFWADSN